MVELNTNYDLGILDRAIKGVGLERSRLENQILEGNIQRMPEEQNYLRKSREQSLEKGVLDIAKERTAQEVTQNEIPFNYELKGRKFINKVAENTTLQNYEQNVQLIQEVLAPLGIKITFPTTTLELIAKAKEEGMEPQQAIDVWMKDNSTRIAELQAKADMMEAEAKKELAGRETKSNYHYETDAKGNVSIYKDGKLIKGSGMGKREKPEKPEKPEWSKKQALSRVSTIDNTLVRLKSSGTIDPVMVMQNPTLAALLTNPKDPEAVNQAIASLENEKAMIYEARPDIKPKNIKQEIFKDKQGREMVKDPTSKSGWRYK